MWRKPVGEGAKRTTTLMVIVMGSKAALKSAGSLACLPYAVTEGRHRGPGPLRPLSSTRRYHQYIVSRTNLDCRRSSHEDRHLNVPVGGGRCRHRSRAPARAGGRARG